MSVPSKVHRIGALTVAVHDGADAVAEAVLTELRSELAASPRPVVSFATGSTFARFFRRVTEEVAAGRLDLACATCTHLDEYLGFAPDRPGGMVHELQTACPPLAAALAAGRFVPVPAGGTDAELAAHRAGIAELGGVSLQLLGVGRNGHIAFNEPPTDFARSFHRTALAATTREDARARFAPDQPPREAVTAGLADILAARRIVLAATGPSKAQAVRAMLEGPIEPQCPASAVREHARVLVLLDHPAAAELQFAAEHQAG